MNCLIIDDDEIARRSIQHCVERTDFLQLAGVSSSVPDALKIIREKKIDLIFLDVEMPEMTGLDFLKTFKSIPQIILVTGKKEYAAEAFDYEVTDFLLKPVDYARFLKASIKAQMIQQNMNGDAENGEDGLFIKKEGTRLVRIAAKDILYIEAL
ncbi:MAG TPA: response regulator, partial [Bacteroidia bacterium]|nr:response regulator [Bacteroidia bacterium]